MIAARFPFRLMPAALALMLSACGLLSNPASTESAKKAETDTAAQQQANREALARQAEAARLKVAANFCEDKRKVLDYAHRFIRREPLPMPPEALTKEQAECVAKGFVKGLTPAMGPVVGYKRDWVSGLADSDGSPQLVQGKLLGSMILNNGVAINTGHFAVHPRIEAKLIGIVRSAAIHDAQTPRELLASLASVHPFMEIPDLAYEKPDRINVAAATMVNGNARYGVMGAPVSFEIDQAMVEYLANMTVSLIDENDNVIEETQGSTVEGNPLNAMLAQVQALENEGIRLRPGDMLSVGIFGSQHKPEGGHSYRVRYEGLPDMPEVIVHFR